MAPPPPFLEALAVTSCAGDPRMIDELGENVRWIIGRGSSTFLAHHPRGSGDVS
jgi:hypothetical protein